MKPLELRFSVRYQCRSRDFWKAFSVPKNKFSFFLEARKTKLAIPQNRGQPTKTVTVKVTKSVVLTAPWLTRLTVIGRGDSSLTELQLE